MDVLQLAEEPPPQPGQELRVWPRGAQEACVVRPAHVEPLLRLCLQQGQVTASTCSLSLHDEPELSPGTCSCPLPQPVPSRSPSFMGLSHLSPSLSPQLCGPLPSLAESRAFAQLSLGRLNPEHKRLEQPAPYQVDRCPPPPHHCHFAL